MAPPPARTLTMVSALVVLLSGGSVPAAAKDLFVVETAAEKAVEQLPTGPLYWRVENFPTIGDARAAAGVLSLAVEAAGRAWLFTLGRKGGATPGGRFAAEIGPVPVVRAPSYLLRINRGGGPPGAATPIHSHPGSEAFHVLTGRLCQRTAHGTARLDAGQSMNGHAPGIAMQLTSCGTTDLDQLVMFVVDATKPFSSPAIFK